MLRSLDDVELLGGERLGAGGSSRVFACRLKSDGKLYALKIVDVGGLSPDERAGLRQEVQLHAGLAHPHIVALYGWLETGDAVYLLLELASRGSLFPYIHAYEGLPEPIALRLFHHTALAVKHLHDRGIIHRDIKPENIVLDADFRAKLCDFGCAARLDSAEDFRTSICGTYEYMPPEVIYADGHTAKADMCCLGMQLYELLHGGTPFQADTLEGIRAEFEQKSIPVLSALSLGARELLRGLLASDARRRLSIDEVLALPLFEQNRALLAQPFSEAERALLLRNRQLNTPGESARTESAGSLLGSGAGESFFEHGPPPTPHVSFYQPYKESLTTAFQRRRAVPAAPPGPRPNSEVGPRPQRCAQGRHSVS